MLHLPYRVEGLFYIGSKHEHREQHHKQTHTEKYAALGVDQIGIDKVDNGLCHLWLA